MSELSIKVNIGGRSYPLTIKRSEEEKIRKKLNKKLKKNRRFCSFPVLCSPNKRNTNLEKHKRISSVMF